MIYKMGMSAEKSWKRLCGFRQLGNVIEEVKFRDGEEVISENSREAACLTCHKPDLTISPPKVVEAPSSDLQNGIYRVSE